MEVKLPTEVVEASCDSNHRYQVKKGLFWYNTSLPSNWYACSKWDRVKKNVEITYLGVNLGSDPIPITQTKTFLTKG